MGWSYKTRNYTRNYQKIQGDTSHGTDMQPSYRLTMILKHLFEPRIYIIQHTYIRTRLHAFILNNQYNQTLNHPDVHIYYTRRNQCNFTSKRTWWNAKARHCTMVCGWSFNSIGNDGSDESTTTCIALRVLILCMHCKRQKVIFGSKFCTINSIFGIFCKMRYTSTHKSNN